MYLDFKQKNNCMYFFQHILHLKCYKLICILSLPAISICIEENVKNCTKQYNVHKICEPCFNEEGNLVTYDAHNNT